MVIAELLGSFEGMNISEAVVGPKTDGLNKAPGLWVDVVADNDHQNQFNLFPSTAINSPASSTGDYNNFNANSTDSASYYGNVADGRKGINDSGLPGPDLRWVDDLLV
uniref:Uncharacterized protein n=1 Tax=Opuntia streptacantha TaxID=393608 RepID=A0A7C8YEN8_OPUST